MNQQKFTILLIMCLLSLGLQAQKKKRILLKGADLMISESRAGQDISILRGNVIFEHDTAMLFCDSAYMYDATNSLDAFGNVRVKLNDSLNLYGDVLFYDGNLRLAEVHQNVRLVDRSSTLYTQHMYYDRVIRRGHYPDSGRIVDGENILTSKLGYYYSDRREYLFRDNVILTNPDYVMRSDTLVYNTQSKTAFIHSPTTITGKEKHMYAEKGWYNTHLDISKLRKNVFIQNKDRTLKADSIFYREDGKYARAYSRVVMHDTTKNIFLKGDFAEYFERNGYTYVTDSAQAIFVEKSDTLYMHADTLRLTFDSTKTARKFYAFNGVRFYRTDLQGISDSLVWTYSDSTVNMYGLPVIWSDEHQLTSDSIRMFINNQKIDSMLMFNSAFIIQMDDSNSFNQVKGRNMKGYFNDGKIYRFDVKGNAETVYYVREEDKSLTGINLVISSNMRIVVEKNEITDIFYYQNPEGATYPETEFPADKKKLQGFKWYGELRPLDRHDIFRQAPKP
ncbi:MAG: OstA-like protein [Bacteroidales bacterium]|nr:OstA-like protein [Bacteroidales bacterium]